MIVILHSSVLQRLGLGDGAGVRSHLSTAQ
jgi:hypothetical protein